MSLDRERIEVCEAWVPTVSGDRLCGAAVERRMFTRGGVVLVCSGCYEEWRGRVV